HRRGQEGELRLFDELLDLGLGAAPGHPLADHDQRPLGALQHIERLLDRGRVGLHAWRLRHALLLLHALVVHLAGDRVAGKVEVDGAGAAVDCAAYGLLDVVGDARRALDAVGILAERPRRLHLVRLLEGAHAVLEAIVGAAEQDHRPAVAPGVGEAGDRVDHAGAGDDEAGLRPAGEVAGRLRGVTRGLLVAHAVELDPLTLGGEGDRHHGDADDAEHILHALLLQLARDQGRAVDLGHSAALRLFCGTWTAPAARSRTMLPQGRFQRTGKGEWGLRKPLVALIPRPLLPMLGEGEIVARGCSAEGEPN